jgi:L-seryl-tRNA(Ser) seleniumtransferase
MPDPRRNLPSVDHLLREPPVAALLDAAPRSVVVAAVRDALDAARRRRAGPPDDWAEEIRERLALRTGRSLRPVLNATGVVLHTNLGRAPLPEEAVEALLMAARHPCALEYDLETGGRGDRDDVVEGVLCELTGAEAATVVNNNAAAVFLLLNTLAMRKQVIVSRGELVEIGGAFRVPDIMGRSGARLVEVGTTNRTHPDDYSRALSPRTRALLKVHRSNFRLTGFTAEVGPAELARLARAGGVASVYDLGSGLLMDLGPWGLSGEPTVREAVASGVDLAIFSGDKLLGGPQAGILVGSTPAIDACRTDPIARAVRADKHTLAALEATLALYRDPDTARCEIPTLRMLTDATTTIQERAATIVSESTRAAFADLVEGYSEVGGGSFPDVRLPTWLIRLTHSALTADDLARRLREGDPPIVARIEREHVVLDPRTILPAQVPATAAVLGRLLGG